MNPTQKAKIKAFVNDKTMAGLVLEFIEDYITAQKSKDINYIAGKMIALEFIREAWIELQRFKEEDKEPAERTTPHV